MGNGDEGAGFGIPGLGELIWGKSFGYQLREIVFT